MRLLKIGPSGVRGVVGDAMTPELIVDFACAFGTYCDSGRVVVGRDTRPSSTMLRSAVLSALISSGCQVDDLGICPTPQVSHAVRETGASGGVSITGSHNDARWNALKFMGPDGALLNALNSEEVLDIYHARAYEQAEWHGLHNPTTDKQSTDRYVRHLVDSLDADAIRARAFRVAIDYCNGAATEAGARFLAALGCKVIPLNDDRSGDFAHPPAPSVANMRQLAALMRNIDADIGAAINVDGDRTGLVTSDGTALSEEYALPLVARRVLPRRAGTVVTNLSTSRMVESVTSSFGCTCMRAAVGEGPVVDKALMEDAVLAGEGNGGVALLSATTTFDALLSLGLVLESMAVDHADLATLADDLPRYTMLKGELACPPHLVYRVLDAFRSRYSDADPDHSDGLRLSWPGHWLHVRASVTEPLLRVIVEGDTATEADASFGEAMTLARRAASGHAVN